MARRIGFAGIGPMGHGAAHDLADKGVPLNVLAHRSQAQAANGVDPPRR